MLTCELKSINNSKISEGKSLDINTTIVPSFEEVFKNNSEVQPGGYWKPKDCYARDRVAIVIPFRDREAHLRILLKYLHPLLQRQQIEYKIFVVEQVGLVPFY